MVASLGCVLAAPLLSGCSAEQSRPAAARSATEPSRIAFSFGGRLHVMRPDGSGLVRLTGGRFGREADGDFMPAWSPDGRRLAFLRTVYDLRSGDGDVGIYLIDASGGSPRRLPVSGDVLSPAWAPDGTRLAFVRYVGSDQREEMQVVVAGLDGANEQVLYRERPGADRLSRLLEPAWSPDGSQIAFTRTTLDKRSYFRPDIYLMQADGGNVRVLARDAAGAAWSPDGRRIAFASVRDRNGVTCGEDECSYRGELYVMDADGTNPVRLTRNRGDDRSPSWSPDGRRIVFASDRNSPGFGGLEIYSIRADGSCLGWLTNGSPESEDPDWSAGSVSSSACGAKRRDAAVQIDTRDVGERHRERAYWLGERYHGRLLDHAGAAREGRAGHSYFFNYADCGRFEPKACAPGLQLQEVSVCARSGSSTLTLVNEPDYGHRIRAYAAHGLLFVDIGQQDLSAVIGTTHVRMFPGVGGPRGLRLARRALLDLREVGGRAGPLPHTALPATMLAKLRRTDLVLKRSGSLRSAARRLGITVVQARHRVELHRTVESLNPPVRSITC